MSKSESGEGRFAALVEVCSENGDESCSISYGDLEAHEDSQSSLSPALNHSSALDSKKKFDLNQILHRTSQFKGVTRHKWTGRYEAHLWDKACKEEGQSRKGKQVYLGGYDMEEKAARAYDLATLKYWGPSTNINFPLESYQKELEEMKNMSRQEYVAHLRRRSSGFSKGSSIYRDIIKMEDGKLGLDVLLVTRTCILGPSKEVCNDVLIETLGTQEEAAEAYDIAAIKLRGTNAVTNFVITRYDVEQIIASLRGNLANKRKQQQPEDDNGSIRQSPPTHNSNVETTHLASQSNQSEIRLEDGTLSVRSATRPETSVDFCDNR